MKRFLKFVLAGVFSKRLPPTSRRMRPAKRGGWVCIRRESLLPERNNARGGRADRIVAASLFFIGAGLFWFELLLEATR